MAANASAVDGEEFFQQEPLIVRLKNLIHDYPEGLGIIKELIQNADDAGAKCIEITLDWRTHAFERLPDERMAALMGPAILIYNDAVFSDADFENIKNLGVGGKKEILWKTGRFGVGFNSVYHVTDYPSFISRDRIVLLDPHGSAIPETSLTKPGRSWRFGEAGWWDSYSDFLKVYEPGGLKLNQVNFQGTLFRLPLRTEEHASRSQIRKQPFTREKNIEPILQELADVGEELLLFLKSVLAIRVQEILGDGTACELLSVKTINQGDVNAEREKLLAPLKDSNVSLLELCQDSSEDLPAVSYLHQIETSCPDRLTTSTWRIASLLRVDEDGELIEVIEELTGQGEKAVPWAGAAARIACETTDEDEKPFVGRAYCFLPLPQKTGLPIHLNGFFDLDSSRRELTSDETLTGRDESRVLWNRLLIRHVVTYACANLISSLVEDVGEVNPKEYYKFWPVKNLENSNFEELPSCLIQVLYDEQVIRVAGEDPWAEPSQVWVLPVGWQKLSKPLIADGVVLPNPALPKNILDAFEKADLDLDIFEPQNLREHLLMDKGLKTVLAEAPMPSLQNPEWVVNLLRYCLEDGCRDIEGLPLAILADGTLQVFGYEDEFLYAADADERAIFVDYPEWFLSPEFVEQVPEVLQCNAVTIMSAQDVAERLADVIDSDQLLQHPWQPDDQSLPNSSWLTLIYKYFSHQDELPIDELKVVPLVPGNDGRLHQGGTALTPLWCGPQIDTVTLEAINYFRVPLVQAPGSLIEAISHFLKKHPDSGFIWGLTAPDLVDTLYAQQSNRGLPAYKAKHYNALVNYLSDRRWQVGTEGFDEDGQSKISELKIFLTAAHEVVALDEVDVYIPGDYEPPSIAGHLKLLSLGPTKSSQIWRSFFEFLDVQTLDRATLIRDCLLSDYSSLSSEEQLSGLEWIRDNLSKAQTELEAIGEDPAALENEIANADLVYCTDANLRPASLIYDPNEEVVRQIFGDAAPIPNMDYYAKGRDRWLKFFRSLGMLVTPSANDLLNYIDGLIQQASQSGTASVSKACMTVYYHIETYWDKLTTEDSRFSQTLKTKTWLPVECRGDELKQYPGACIPENRLYRPEEVSFIQDVHLVASQRPLFRVKSPPKRDIQEALGFRSRSWRAALNHFKVLTDLWETKEHSNINQDNFRTALETIYKHLASICLGSGAVDRNNQINEQVKNEIYNQLADQKCLWKEDSFWKPEHAFRRSVPFFGKRRVKIDPSDSTIRGIYEFLGQKAVPETSDYIAFLNEVYEDAEDSPLDQDDVDCVIKTLNQLTKDLSKEEELPSDLSDLLLLTEDLLLLPADEVWIPDAHWRLDGVRKCGIIKLLHPNISPEIAQRAGSPSLLEADEVSKQPVEISQDSKAISMCLQWQQTLRTQEFAEGVERLIWHEYYPDYTIGTIDLEWLQEVSILPADRIVTDLYADDQPIALNIPGDQHYDSEQNIFYLRYDSSFPEVMVDYLGEGLTIRLDEFTLSDRSALIRILNTDSRNISSLLDNLRIRPLPKMDNEDEDEDDSEAAKDDLFGRKPNQRNSSDDSEEEAQEVEQGVSETATSTEAQPRQIQQPAADSSTNRGESTVGGTNTSSTTGKHSSFTGSNGATPKYQPSAEGSDDSCDDDDEEWNNGSSQDFTRGDRSRSSEFNSGGRSYQPSSRSETNEVRKESTGAGDRHRPTTSNSETHASSTGTNGSRKSENTHTSERRKTARDNSHARAQQYRLRTYVNSSQTAENDPEDQYPQEIREQIDCAGMKRVLEYERSQERNPKEMPKNHPGYDIESTDNSGLPRFIEVKSSRDYWGQRGVKLSRTQFQVAQEMGESYWLYVVERAEEDSEFQIFKIQNPALRVQEFYYDAGWQEVAEADEAEDLRPASV